MGVRLALAVLFAIGLSTLAAAVEPDEMLNDPALEARARAISLELRCPVCQSEAIDASDAPLAKDLRLLVRQRLLAGDTDEEVLDYVYARYGDYVLLRPRVKPQTWALWFGPFAAALLGLGAIALYVARRSGRREATADAAPLTAAEEAKLREIVKP